MDPGQEAPWAAILVGFGLFHKDNLTAGKTCAWNTREMGASAGGAGLSAVPSAAPRRLMERTAGRPVDSALFVVEKVTDKRVVTAPMTHGALVAGSKSLVKRMGSDPVSYARRSLRSGGATAALLLDVNNMHIKLQGI
ncbi:hypothetical protein CYMTET_26779 [Cymbomonas tetramitiformis]|uniref:Uncharacterized protein n=1 Tax=Cymbomonas tetramitiformis TaxID=36881 RepID=A0AAE0KXW7_9CHLO|nr:hypothetical protein CYMTET_26779 [Cymbomonas tetramitiformis]